MFSQIALEGLVVEMSIGWDAEERSRLQPIRLDFYYRSPSVPKATVSDELEDTISYDEAPQLIAKVLESREFRLLESFGFECLRAVRRKVPEGTLVALRVTKLHPPIPGFSGTSSFWLGDWQEPT